MDDSFSFEGFYEGAKKAAYKAMDDHARGEYDEFALHAGVAIERLAKAVLYKLNPLYIASGKVHLGGQKARVYTITATEALSRLSSLNILKGDDNLKLLIEQRNGTVHASVGDEAKIHIPTLAKAIGPMLKHLDVSEHDFWGRWTSAVNVAVDRQRSDVERDVQLRIKQARHRLEDRLEGLPLPNEIRLRPKVSGFSFFFGAVNPDVDGDIVSVTGGAGCPACGREAQVTVEPSSDRGAVAVALACPWCQLRLNSAEEVEASDADLAISLEVAESALYGDIE
ncbi:MULTISPECIES: hypothetical protein [unclassified Streptomyces]|uniref:hypothetical protein n=1 Tax=unclassified Streptomyces TaxID=2593676 RepID=UPI0036FD3512